MTEGDVGAIIRELEDFKGEVREAHGEIKNELVALKAWQTLRDDAAHNREVIVAAYTRPLRWALRLWGSDFAKFLLALAIASAGSRWLR